MRTQPQSSQMLQLATAPASQVVALKVQPEPLPLTVEEAAKLLVIRRSLM